MISRDDYVGPVTKSAEAMFERADRRARRAATGAGSKTPRGPRASSPLELTIGALGLTTATLRHWEDAGVVAFERRNGRRIVDEAALEALRTVALLRRAGLSIRQITWLSETTPPSTDTMLRALRDRQDYLELQRTNSIYRAKMAACPKAVASMGSRP